MDNKILPRQPFIRMNVAREQVVKVEHRGTLDQTNGGVFRAVVERAAVAVIDAPHALYARAGTGAVI